MQNRQDTTLRGSQDSKSYSERERIHDITFLKIERTLEMQPESPHQYSLLTRTLIACPDMRSNVNKLIGKCFDVSEGHIEDPGDRSGLH
ncbi:hypothetical protein V6N13_145935 [Hibiscus sabdariffa]